MTSLTERTIFTILILLLSRAALASPGAEPSPWFGTDAAGRPRVELYFFWSERCPHCLQARPYMETLAGHHAWLRLHAFEVSHDRGNAARFKSLAESVGETPRSVPAFLFCGRMITGFESEATTGAWLEQELRACRRQFWPEDAAAGNAATAPRVARPPPLPGGLDPTALSVPALTVALAALDSINPCAFFVLLFLLSLMVHARSRSRMLLVGGVFVIGSGLIYFLFMAAWLNLYLVLGGLHWITLTAGFAAVGLGTLNIKDFIGFHRGPSLSIPPTGRPRLFERMRGLVGAEQLTTMLVGTVVLALVANSYELLCTAGFPLVYTRILTLRALPPGTYYAYLLLYNVIYVLPLLTIVGVFTWTLGSRKLSAREGRALKLLSGMMMLELGAVLLVAPDALDSPVVAASLVAIAVAVTAAAVRLGRTFGRGEH